jgi:tetratricopeptide (TPR) repeat protein
LRTGQQQEIRIDNAGVRPALFFCAPFNALASADAFCRLSGYQCSRGRRVRLPSMDFPLRETLSRIGARSLVTLAQLSLAICGSGCSFNLSSLSPDDAPKPGTPTMAAPAAVDSLRTSPQDALVQVARAQALMQVGNSEEALKAYNTALELDPHNAQAFYLRGLLYQTEKQYEFAIADFTSANGLTPQQADPLLGRAQCYLALGKSQEAAADLDEASQVAPGNAQVWITRGATYEKLGDKSKAADSFSRAVLLRPKDDAARNGMVRNGGKAG